MKKITTLVLVLSFFIVGSFAFAKDSQIPAGTTPDSNFYFMKEWKEKIQTFFTFGLENKATQFLHLSEIRLAEYQKMIEKGKTEIAQKTLEKYQEQLGRAIEKANELKNKEKDTTVINEKVKQTVNKNLEVLQQNLQKVPEQAKEGIQRAIENAERIKKNSEDEEKDNNKRSVSCTADSECACGTHITTGECFYGNKAYVNTKKQCPDFCTGIYASFIQKCVEKKCEKVLASEQDVGIPKDVKIGETINFSFASNPSTGFSWQANYDKTIIELTKQEFKQTGPVIPGAGGIEYFTFKGLKLGVTELKFTYLRPWESVQPADEKIYKITVK